MDFEQRKTKQTFQHMQACIIESIALGRFVLLLSFLVFLANTSGSMKKDQNSKQDQKNLHQKGRIDHSFEIHKVFGSLFSARVHGPPSSQQNALVSF
jgi:hypothetical protein